MKGSVTTKRKSRFHNRGSWTLLIDNHDVMKLFKRKLNHLADLFRGNTSCLSDSSREAIPFAHIITLAHLELPMVV